MARQQFDLVNFTKKYKGELHEFFLDLKRWKQFKTRHRLPWTKVRFAPAFHASIPNQRGIYVFTVELSPGKLPLHGYIMYVGITGDTGRADLHQRYGQYQRELKHRRGRPAVQYMMQNWRDDLFFNYVTVPNTATNLKTLEDAFINCIMPPVNKRDFEAKIGKAKAAKF